MILFGDVEHAAAIARGAGVGYDPEVNHVLSRIAATSRLLGGVIYTNYNGRTVQAHMAGFVPGWATRAFLWCAFDFPFNYMKVEQVLATVATTNEKCRKIVLDLGFKSSTSIPRAVPGGDMEILSMSREDCKYLMLASRYPPAPMENVA